MDLNLEMPEIGEEPETLSAKDEAFLLAEGKTNELSFGNASNGGPVTLQAFDTYRTAAAGKLGVGFLKWTAEDIQEFAATGTYDGMLADAIIVGFLCARPQAMAVKAIRHPETYLNLALQWGEKHGIRPLASKTEELVDFFANTLLGILESQAEVDPVGTRDTGESLGE